MQKRIYNVSFGSLNVNIKETGCKHMTPPVFDLYKPNIAMIFFGLVSFAFIFSMIEQYAFLYMIDLVLSMSYLFSVTLILFVYKIGLLDCSANPISNAYWIQRLIAYSTQSSIPRVILFNLLYMYDPHLTYYNPMNVDTLVSSIWFGLFISTNVCGFIGQRKFCSRSSERVFRTMLNGPEAMGDSLDSYIANKPFYRVHKCPRNITKTKEIEELESKIYHNHKYIESLKEKYTNDWQKSIYEHIFFGYKDLTISSLTGVKIERLVDAYNADVKKLNKLYDSFRNRNENKTKTQNNKPSAEVKKTEKNQDIKSISKPNNDFWETSASWY